jgi:hypothetical protein
MACNQKTIVKLKIHEQEKIKSHESLSNLANQDFVGERAVKFRSVEKSNSFGDGSMAD